MGDFPPPGHIGQVHGAVAAAVEAHDHGRRALVEDIVVVVGEIADLVGGLVLVFAHVVRGGLHGVAARVLGHAQGREVRFVFDLSAPHFELFHEGVEVFFIFGLFLDEQVLAALKGLVGLRAVARAEDGDVLPLHVRYHAQFFHGAHGRGDLAGSPQVFALQGLQQVLRHIVGGGAEGIDVRAEDRAADEVALELLREEVVVLHDAVFVDHDHLDFGDHRGIKALVFSRPAAFLRRIDEEDAGVEARRDLRQTCLVGEAHRAVHVLSVFLEHQQARRPETVVVHLAVQIVVRHVGFQFKLVKGMLPAFSAGDFPHLRSFHHGHRLILLYLSENSVSCIR